MLDTRRSKQCDTFVSRNFFGVCSHLKSIKNKETRPFINCFVTKKCRSMKNPLWQMFISHFFDRLIKRPKTIFGKLQAVGIFWIILLHQCDDGVDSNGAEKNVWDLIVTTIIEVDFRTFGVLWLAGSGCRSRTIKQNHCYSETRSFNVSQFHFSALFSSLLPPQLCLLLHFSLGS